MKKHIISLSAMAVALGMITSSCDDNSWNDHLDGFEGEQTYTVVEKVSYTLTTSDYSTIAGLATNVTLAGDANSAALAALKKNCYFTDVITPDAYIPAFLASSKFEHYLLDNGSTVNVTYAIAQDAPEELDVLKNAAKVTVSTDDYIEAWGSDDDYIVAYTNAVKAARNIPKVLAAQDIDTEYAIVTYKYASQEPVFANVGADESDDALESGARYMIVADEQYAATAIADTYTYGYLTNTSVDTNALDFSNETLLFTFTKTSGGYYIQDCYNRYIYQSGTYSSFNVSDEPVEGSIWACTQQSDGTWEILNTSVEKWIQYSVNYSSYGSYNTESGLMPKLYQAPAAAAVSPKQKASVVDVATETQFAIYKNTDGTWAEDTSIALLQPADYTQMGSSNNYISTDNVATYLPIYMDREYPYAAKNDTKYAVYFTSSSGAVGASLMTFNGTAWSVDNFVTTTTTAFTKQNGSWSASAGLAEFTHVKVSELTSGGKYMIVTDGFASKCISSSSTYGYLYVSSVDYDATHINLTDDADEYEFTFTLTDKGWLISDMYDRYYYQTGTYNSFNVSTEISDSSSDGFYWDVNFTDEGVEIVNKVVDKTWQYDENYGSYGSYAAITHTLPNLYVAASE